MTSRSTPATPPSGDGAPIGSVKDVGIRADRADGFVLDNVKVRHATEHDIYVLETDGYHLDRFKAPYAGEYGVLTFVADHRLIENCEAWGSGDSGLYPGRQRRPRRGRAAGPAPLRHRDPQLRHAPQHARLLGHRRQRRLAPQQQLLRQRASASRPTSSPRPATRASRRTPTCSRTTTSTRTTSTPTCRSARGRSRPERAEPGLLGRRPDRPGAGRHRHVDRGRQRQHRPQQPLLRQLAPRRDALRGARPVRLRRPEQPGGRLRPDGDRRRRPRTATSSTTTRWAWRPTAASQPNGVDFWWDQGGISIDPTLNTANCWYNNTGPDGTAGSVTGTALAERRPAEQPAVRLRRQPVRGRHARAGRPSF